MKKSAVLLLSCPDRRGNSQQERVGRLLSHPERGCHPSRCSKGRISAGLHAFGLALDIRDREQLPFSVGLGFSLKSGTQPQGVNFVTTTQLEEEFVMRSPPSLYLFRQGEEPWAKGGHESARDNGRNVTIEKVDPAILGEAVRGNGCFYFEFKTIGEEYSRSIFVAG